MTSEDEVKRRLELLELRMGRQERRFGLLAAVLTLILAPFFLFAVPFVASLLTSGSTWFLVPFAVLLFLPVWLLAAFYLIGERHKHKRKQ